MRNRSRDRQGWKIPEVRLGVSGLFPAKDKDASGFGCCFLLKKLETAPLQRLCPPSLHLSARSIATDTKTFDVELDTRSFIKLSRSVFIVYKIVRK